MFRICKMGLIGLLVLSMLISIFTYSGEAYTELKDTINIDIPDYTIKHIDEYDEVIIPGGRNLSIEGKPLIPYYVVKRWYPRDIEIQDVELVEKSGLKEEKDLNIKTYKIQWGGDIENNERSSSDSTGWFPDRNYSWFVEEEVNETNKLVLFIFPFIYNNQTKEGKFYKHFVFNVNYISSDIRISNLYPDKSEYDIGDTVTINMVLSSEKEQPETIIAIANIKKYGTIIDSIQPVELKDFVATGETSLKWDTTGIDYGRYEVEAEIRNLEGFVLDRESIFLTIGKQDVNITSFDTDKKSFKIGDDVNFFATIENLGNTTASGHFIVEVRCEGEVIEKFDYPFRNLSAGESLNFDGKWKTTNATKDKVYYLVGYVSCGGRSTLPLMIELKATQKQKGVPGFEISILIIIIVALSVIMKKKRLIGM